MNSRTPKLRAAYAAWVACALFFFTGRAFVPHLGVQNDEALFAAAVYPPHGGIYIVQLGHSKYPLMLMSYLGTLKSWIYRPVFRWFGTSVSALRDPMLLAGTATVWLFYLLLRSISGERAGIIGCSLLAVDSLYLLTICFDWGPVALQHLLLVSAILLLFRFYQTHRTPALAGGFYLMGLAMWDKAIALWLLGGIFVAGIGIFPRPILRVTGFWRVLTAVLAFALGSLPLIVYNVDNHWETFRNHRYELNALSSKAELLAGTADASAMFGWLVDENWKTPVPHQPKGWIQSAAVKISALAGHPRRNLMLYAFALALLLAPLARGHELRAILFALIAMVVGWLQMAITVNAGGSVHHAILLWPLPEMAIGVSLAAASRRLGRAGIPAVTAVTGVLVVSSLLVTNEYFKMMNRNGGGMNWTNAIFGLSDYLKGVQATGVYSMDWGIMDSLRLLNRGKLPLEIGFDQIGKPAISPEERSLVHQMIGTPEHVFVAHTADFQFFKGYSEKLLTFAAEAGYQRQMMAVISDAYGRQVYEVYRFARAP